MENKCKICGRKTKGSFKTGLCRRCFVTVGNPFRQPKIIEKIKKHQKGKTNSNWKGNKVSYRGLHVWIRKNWGNASRCEYCKNKKVKRYDWANINGKYDRNKKNYMQLCRSCHMKLDRYKSIKIN